MPKGLALGVGIGNSPVMTPAVVILTISFMEYSVNHRLPSGPAVIPIEYPPVTIWVIEPAGVTRPTQPEGVVNQRFPSGPVAIPCDPN